MGHQWTLRWQKSAWCLQSHSMPHLRILQAILLLCNTLPVQLMFIARLLQLLRSQESQLCSHTEVAHRQKNDLFEHCVSWKLMTIVDVEVKFFKWHGEQVHDVADVKIEDPVVLVFYAENCFYVVLQLGRFNEITICWLIDWFAFIKLLWSLLISYDFSDDRFNHLLLRMQVIILQLLVIVARHATLFRHVTSSFSIVLLSSAFDVMTVIFDAKQRA